MTCMAAELEAVRELDRLWIEAVETGDPVVLARYRELRPIVWVLVNPVFVVAERRAA